MLLLILPFSLLSCYQESPSSNVQNSKGVLLRLLHDPDAMVRRTAAEALGKIGDQGAVTDLLGVLSDESAVVREAAVKALGHIDPLPPEAGERIVRLLEDPIPEVRTAAVHTVGGLDYNERVRITLIGLLGSRDPETIQAVLDALGEWETKDSAAVLARYLSDVNPQVRRLSVIAIAASGDSRAVALVQERLKSDPSPEVRAEAAYRLGFLGSSEERFEVELAARGDDRPQVRRWAQQSLMKLRE